MGLIVAEKSFKNATNHRMEATIGMMVSGHKNFPVLFGETKNSLIMEFVGDPHTLRPADTILNIEIDTIHDILKQKQRQLDWANITRQIVSAFAALHSKGILHCDIHTKNVLLYEVNSLVKVVDFGMACLIRKSRVYDIGGTPQEAVWDERYPHVAYEIRHRERQPANCATDTFMVDFYGHGHW